MAVLVDRRLGALVSAVSPAVQPPATRSLPQKEKPAGDNSRSVNFSLSSPTPCPACGNPIFWCAIQSTEFRCGHCDPWPAACLIGIKIIATADIDGVPTWEKLYKHPTAYGAGAGSIRPGLRGSGVAWSAANAGDGRVANVAMGASDGRGNREPLWPAGLYRWVDPLQQDWRMLGICAKK